MRRREVLTLLGGAAAAWPVGVRAQQPIPLVGYLAAGSPTVFETRLAAFRRGLEESGYVEGRNVAIEYRWADGLYDRMRQFATDLVTRKVDVIATIGPPSLRAASEATKAIPVVFVVGSDPVRDGLVDSMSRPNGNLTGISFLAVDLTPKRFELISELVPQAKVIGLLANPTNAAEERVVAEMQVATRANGFQFELLKASSESEIEIAFSGLNKRKLDVLIASPDSLFTTHTGQIVSLASRYGVPTIYAFREFATAGGLASYGPSIMWVHRQAGNYVGRILKGEKVGNLPIMLPSTFELVINLKTARALGLTVPPTLLARADEVIE